MKSGNELKKVTDEGIILNLLQGTKDNIAEVYVWRFLGGNKHVAPVRIESVRKLRRDFCIVPQDGQDRIVQELIGSQNSIDLYVPSYGLLLRCNVKQTDAPYRYYLQIPQFVAQVERRQSMRLNVHEEGDVKVNFGKTMNVPKAVGQHFHKSCFDLSPGGLSFYVSKAEAKFFQIGDEIKQMEVKTSSWSSKVDVQVVYIQEVEPNEYNGLSYKAWKVACRFGHIDQVFRKYLEKFIFERIKDELHAINI